MDEEEANGMREMEEGVRDDSASQREMSVTSSGGEEGAHNDTTLTLNATIRSRGDEEMWEDTDEPRLNGGARYVIQDNVKVFNSAIHTMSRFSDNLHFEPTTIGLRAKAISNTQSAFASFHFKAEFFNELDVTQVHPDTYNMARISMKSALANFNAFSRSTPISYCLHIDPTDDIMVVRTRMFYHVTKCSTVNLRECAATYSHLFSDKSKLENCITLSPAVLIAVLPQIGVDVEEMKLTATADKLTLERYIPDDVDRSHLRKTEVSLDVEQLDLYSIRRPGHVCIRLKEFKSVLHFANQAGLLVNIYFDMPGKPVIVAVEENVDFEAEFTLGSFALPSHELERLLQPAQPRVTEATTLRASNEFPPPRPPSARHDGVEGSGGTEADDEGSRARSSVREKASATAVTAAPIIEEPPREEMDDAMDEGGSHRDKQEEREVEEEGIEMFLGESASQPGGIAQRVEGQQQSPQGQTTLSPHREGVMREANFLQREIFNYDSPGEEDEGAQGDDERSPDSEERRDREESKRGTTTASKQQSGKEGGDGEGGDGDAPTDNRDNWDSFDRSFFR